MTSGSPNSILRHRTAVSRRTHLTRAAFSLIEVTLAIGIMAFAVVPVVGLLPIGLRVHRDSMVAIASTQIVGRVTHELEQTDYSTLPGVPNTTSVVTGPLTYYFDDQGDLLPSATDSRRIYDVQATVNAPSTLPALSGVTTTTASLARVEIDIGLNPGRSASIFARGSNGAFTNSNVSTYFAFVSKND